MFTDDNNAYSRISDPSRLRSSSGAAPEVAYPTLDTNREGNPVSLSSLIDKLEASTGMDMSSAVMRHCIWAAVDRLPTPERNLINMIYFREEVRHSDAELASELGINEPKLSRRQREILNGLTKAIFPAGIELIFGERNNDKE